jgi:hypothetical protein
MKSETLNELAAALVAAQSEFPTVGKDSTNPFFKNKYASFAAVVEAASPTLTKHGLAVSQHVGGSDGNTVLTTYLLHSSGQYIAHDMPLLLPKQDPQGQGSAITYAKRYSYMAVLGLVADEDDDANKASNKPAEAYSAPQKAELVDPGKMKRLRELMASTGHTGAKATDLCLFLLNKEAPTNNADVDTLIKALEEK